MRPSQASAALRRIASLIDKSRRPDRALVARDLRRVLAAMESIQVPGVSMPFRLESFENMFEALDPIFQTRSQHGEHFQLDFMPLDEITANTGAGVWIVDLGTDLGVNVAYEGSGDLVYSAPKAQFDPKAAARAAFDALKNIVDTMGLGPDQVLP